MRARFLMGWESPLRSAARPVAGGARTVPGTNCRQHPGRGGPDGVGVARGDLNALILKTLTFGLHLAVSNEAHPWLSPANDASMRMSR